MNGRLIQSQVFKARSFVIAMLNQFEFDTAAQAVEPVALECEGIESDGPAVWNDSEIITAFEAVLAVSDQPDAINMNLPASEQIRIPYWFAGRCVLERMGRVSLDPAQNHQLVEMVLQIIMPTWENWVRQKQGPKSQE